MHFGPCVFPFPLFAFFLGQGHLSFGDVLAGVASIPGPHAPPGPSPAPAKPASAVISDIDDIFGAPAPAAAPSLGGMLAAPKVSPRQLSGVPNSTSKASTLEPATEPQ